MEESKLQAYDKKMEEEFDALPLPEQYAYKEALRGQPELLILFREDEHVLLWYAFDDEDAYWPIIAVLSQQQRKEPGSKILEITEHGAYLGAYRHLHYYTHTTVLLLVDMFFDATRYCETKVQ